MKWSGNSYGPARSVPAGQKELLHGAGRDDAPVANEGAAVVQVDWDAVCTEWIWIIQLKIANPKMDIQYIWSCQKALSVQHV